MSFIFDGGQLDSHALCLRVNIAFRTSSSTKFIYLLLINLKFKCWNFPTHEKHFNKSYPVFDNNKHETELKLIYK